MTFTSKWDPQYKVTNVRGPVLWPRLQATDKTLVINRNKVVLVDPNIEWDVFLDREDRPVQMNKYWFNYQLITENQSDKSESGHDFM